MPHPTSQVSLGLRTRVGGLFASLLMLLSLLATIPLLSGPAYADLGGGAGGDGDGPVCGVGSCTTPPPTGDPSGGTSGGTSGGGSGGVSTAGTFSEGGIVWLPERPPSPIGGGTFWGVIWGDSSKVYRYKNKCGGTAWTDSNGKSFGYLGTEWSLSGSYVTPYINPDDGFEIPETWTATAGGYECIDPPKYNIYDWDCFIGGNASYTGPRRNAETPVVGSSTTGLGYKQSLFAKTGKTSISRCLNPERLYWEVDGLKALGQYDLETTARMQKCEFYDYYTTSAKASVNDTDYLTCAGGAKYDAPQETDKLELFCEPPGRHKVFHNYHTFSYEDCKVPSGTTTTGATEWSCGPVPTPVFNGRSSVNGRFDVLDDAKERKLKWARPVPEGGIRDLKNRTVRLALGEGVSPFRGGDPANGWRQPFTVDSDERDHRQNLSVDEWRSGWNQAMPAANGTDTGWDLAFMAPGVPDKPWEVAPTWAFDAEFLRFVPGEVKVDLETGTWTIDMVKEWVDGNGVCSGDPAALDVYRARTNQGN